MVVASGGELSGSIWLQSHQDLPVPVLQLPGGQNDGGHHVVQAAVLGHDVDVAVEAGEEEAQDDLVLVALCPVLQLGQVGDVDDAHLGGSEGDGEREGEEKYHGVFINQ